MLATIRRALTPSADQSEDKDVSNSSLNTSPAAPGLLIRDSTPPPFSPIEPSQEETSPPPFPPNEVSLHENLSTIFSPINVSRQHQNPPWAAQALNANDPMMARSHALPMDISSDQDSMESDQEANDESLLGPATATDHTTESRRAIFSLDGASDDHPRVSKEDSQLRRSPLPSAEPMQSTSKAQRTQRTPTPSSNHIGLNSKNGNTSLPPNTIVTTNGEDAAHPKRAQRVTSKSATASVEPQQGAPQAPPDDAATATSSKAPLSKRKRDDETLGTDTKHAKKNRGQKKEEDSTAGVEQQGSTKDETTSEKRGMPKQEKSSSGSVRQQDAIEGEAPKKRGRPKKEDRPTPNIESSSLSNDVSTKRGKSREEPALRATRRRDAVDEDDTGSKETPKKRGRPGKEAEPAGSVEPAETDAPKKRGRPKKGEGAAQGIEPRVASTADTPRKSGRPKNNKDVVEATMPQGSPSVETTKKRGRPKGTQQGETSKAITPGKRGRPKKDQGEPKGTKPVGIVKKKAGRK